MATQVGLAELCTALDDFGATIDATVIIGDAEKAELLRKYQRLIELIPAAFELDAEHDRREPAIVEALLLQIEGVERLTLEKLFAVGLNRIDRLTAANAEEIAVVTGIRPAVAAAIVEQFQKYRVRGAVSVRDPAAELRELATLINSLSSQNAAFERAASEWTDDARMQKRELRKQREQTFQRIKVTLARLGAREQMSRLEKLPFDARIADLERYLNGQSHVR
jgi:hypothetical protein